MIENMIKDFFLWLSPALPSMFSDYAWIALLVSMWWWVWMNQKQAEQTRKVLEALIKELSNE
jgi:hypothetical protein